MGSSENRVHTRIEIDREVRVSGPQGVQEGRLHDISKGGACIYLAAKLGEQGDTMEFFLPLPDGQEIAVMGEILRMAPTPKGIIHGIRFSLVEPAMQELLNRYLEKLVREKGPQSRRHPRLAKRLPIRFSRSDEASAILRNISMGGLSMHVGVPLVLFEEMDVTLPDTNGRELLLIRGEVVHQYKEERHGQVSYQVGLQFKQLTPLTEVCLKAMLDFYVTHPIAAT